MKPIIKAVFFALFFLFCLSFAYASVFLVKPLEQTASDNELLELGLVSTGSTLEIILSNDAGQEGVVWQRASLQNLPSGWEYSFSSDNPKRLSLLVTIPKDAPENVYQFRVIVTSSDALSESFSVKVEARKNVVQAVVSEQGSGVQEIFVGETKSFGVNLFNQSVADTTVIVGSNLPADWYDEHIVTIPAKQSIDVSFPVTAQVHGRKDFSVKVTSMENGTVLSSFDSFVLARPTLAGKLSATSLGFPFFSPTLGPVYFFSAFIGSFLK